MFELMRQWEESDDDRISFCKANGLALASLSYWRTKYRNPHFASPSQDFFELKPTSRLVLEIDYANGVVDFPVKFSVRRKGSGSIDLMFSLTSSHHYFLYDQATDMRKSFDGLSAVVQSQLQKDPMSGDVYVFINKQCNGIKLLH